MGTLTAYLGISLNVPICSSISQTPFIQSSTFYDVYVRLYVR